MKVEIDIDELAQLKNTMYRTEQELSELKRQLKALDEEAIKESIKQSADNIFRAYVSKTFEHLGFTNTIYNVNYQCGFQRDFYNRWDLEVKDLKIELSADLSNEWKTAFLRIGVVTPK